MYCTQGNIAPSHKVLLINQCFIQGFNGLIQLSIRLAASTSLWLEHASLDSCDITYYWKKSSFKFSDSGAESLRTGKKKKAQNTEKAGSSKIENAIFEELARNLLVFLKDSTIVGT